MKKIKIKTTALSLILMFLLSACGTTYHTASDNNIRSGPNEGKRVVQVQNPRNLMDFLVQAPGVAFRNGEISIRGGGPPLFILDGVPIGNGFYSAVSTVNPLDIESVEVISGPETAIYGRQGINGVIVIQTWSL